MKNDDGKLHYDYSLSATRCANSNKHFYMFPPDIGHLSFMLRTTSADLKAIHILDNTGLDTFHCFSQVEV